MIQCKVSAAAKQDTCFDIAKAQPDLSDSSNLMEFSSCLWHTKNAFLPY